jgi:hypothetical protein
VNAPRESATATSSVAGQSVETTPTDEIQPTPSELNTQQSPPVVTLTSDNSLEPLYSALSQFTVPNNGIGIFDTGLGRSAIVNICTQPGLELRETLTKVMDTIAKEHAVYATQVATVGTQMIDCDTNTSLLVVGVATNDAQSYAEGNLTEAEFQGRWHAIRFS